MRLLNVVMQLRKVASHPFLFDWPIDHRTGQAIINKDLVEASGKMLLLNRLLDALFEKKHKVLLFSQFTTMLNIIEVSLVSASGLHPAPVCFRCLRLTRLRLTGRQDWAIEYKGIKVYRIDGTTKQADRQAQMNAFNAEGEEDGVCRLFILSTRAGGLGINLVAADTVIFYDQDWNPQMDLQAQDRAHRIGQKRPVLVFRLVTAHTVEEKILKKAGAKRRLEAMVIADGKFKGGAAPDKRVSAIDEATALLKLEGDKIDLVDAGDKIISYVSSSPHCFLGSSPDPACASSFHLQR
jgi:ATP-dependent DNA helicase